MARNEFYQQCILIRPSENGGEEHTTTYLPASAKLKPGASVRFRNKGSEPWSEGWVVKEASQKKPGDMVEDDETLYKRHRDVTDV